MSSFNRRFEPPWDFPEWRDETLTWIREEVDRLGFVILSQPETVHARPWSAVMKVPTNRGNLFFKAGGPTQQFEPGLLRLLNDRWAEHTLPVLAADTSKGWSLMPDGGLTLRQIVQGKPDFAAWREILRQYAELQIEASQWANELINAGVPERPSKYLVEAYTEILADGEISLVGDGEDFLTSSQHQKLARMASAVIEMFIELDSYGIPLSLEHGDLHDANIFVQIGRYRIFDWGAASLTHPFFTLLLPLRHMADKLGVTEYTEHPELTSLVNAYLEPWVKFAPRQQLREAWKLAHHLAKFVRAINWYRVVKSTIPSLVADYQASISGWFLEFLNHPTTRLFF